MARKSSRTPRKGATPQKSKRTRKSSKKDAELELALSTMRARRRSGRRR